MKSRVIFFDKKVIFVFATLICILLAIIAIATVKCENCGCEQCVNGHSVQNDNIDCIFNQNTVAKNQNLRHVSSFSTKFNWEATDRSFNIALASQSFCYRTVESGQKLSFNEVVGKRLVERGYRTAKVIENGEYVLGVGGGVCQVSTTLYNAWIRAGLGVLSVKAHSLPSSYCGLSQDATVSDFIDLVLINDSDYDVIVNAVVEKGVLRFDIYGQESEYSYKFESRTIKTIPPGEPLLEYVEKIEGGLDHKQISPPKDGYISELIRYTYKKGVLIAEEVMRKDIYRAVKAKILVAESYD